MASTRFQFNTARIIKQIEAASDDALNRLATQGAGYTARNITENGQVDTGAMRASAQALPVGSGGTDTLPSMPPHTAGVGVGADYAIYNEVNIPFLYPALQELENDVPAACAAAGAAHGL